MDKKYKIFARILIKIKIESILNLKTLVNKHIQNTTVRVFLNLFIIFYIVDSILIVEFII